MLITVFVLLLATSLAQGDPLLDWTGFQPANSPPPNPIVINSSFEGGAEGWNLTEEAQVLPGAGSNLSSGLVVERRDNRQYSLSYQDIKGIIPGQRYNLRAICRSENVAGQRTGASFCIEHSDKDGKFISMTGSYPNGLFGTSDWTEITIRGHLVPLNATNTRVTFYLGREATGKAFFDDLTVTPAETPWCLYLLNAPQGCIRTGQVLKCRIIPTAGGAIPETARANAEFQGHSVTVVPAEGQAVFPTGNFSEGRGSLTVRIYDDAKKIIYAEYTMLLTVSDRSPRVSFDERGRTLLDGRKFLPIGLFGNISNRETVDTISDAGFNVTMPYNSVHMGIDGLRGYDGITAALDYCAQKNLYVIFCLKGVYSWGDAWVNQGLYGEFDTDKMAAGIAVRYATHPALFGYYTADEVSQQHLPDLTARRTQLNRLDFNHPVWQVHSLGYNTNELEPFGPACDVIGIDFYPFDHSAVSIMANMEEKITLAFRCGLPQWFVPQAFNWRRYNHAHNGKFGKSAFPATDEYRAQILMAAGCGVKGFMFYVYQPLCLPDPVLDGDAATMKETIQDGNRLLRKMEPSILSDIPPEKIAVKNLSGQTSAWLFQSDNGQKCIAVISLVPGRNVAEFTLNEGAVYSSWGKTAIVGAKARFESSNISCDLLEFTR